MDKKTVLIVVLAAIIIVLGILDFSKLQVPPAVTQSTPVVRTAGKIPNTLPGVTPGSMTINVEKIQGQQIFFLSTAKKEISVTVGSATKIVQQVNNNGVFKDVPIQFSALKSGQILEVTTDSSGTNAKTIRLLP